MDIKVNQLVQEHMMLTQKNQNKIGFNFSDLQFKEHDIKANFFYFLILNLAKLALIQVMLL